MNAAPEPTQSWMHVHETLTRFARERAARDFEEGQWLVRALRERVWVRLGYGSNFEYLERLFGYTARMVAEKLRVAEALAELPVLGAALQGGQVPWSTAREVTRVATPSTEADWLAAASGKGARQVEELVAGHRPGDRPLDPPGEDLRKHVLRFEVAAETVAAFRDARGLLEREVGHSLSDDDVLHLLARRALGGPTDEGRANYQVAVTTCDSCGRGWQQAQGTEVQVSPEALEMAACDAQTVPLDNGEKVEGHTHVGRATQSVPPAVRRLVVRRDKGRCVVPGCRRTRFLDVHHLTARHDGGDHDPDNLALLCSTHHRAIHAGFLFIEGAFSTGLRFQHADGTVYGAGASPQAAELSTLAFQALKKMGYGDADARRGVAAAQTHVGAGLETVIVEALGALSVREGEATYGVN